MRFHHLLSEFTMKNILKISMILALIIIASPLNAEDWTGFLGPKRNGQAIPNIEAFAEEPNLIWSAPVGDGFSGPVVFAGTVFLHHRNQNTEEITSFDLKSGKVNWNKSFPTTYKDDFHEEMALVRLLRLIKLQSYAFLPMEYSGRLIPATANYYGRKI